MVRRAVLPGLAFLLLGSSGNCGGTDTPYDITRPLSSYPCWLPPGGPIPITDRTQVDLVVRALNVLHSRQQQWEWDYRFTPPRGYWRPARDAEGARYPLRLKGIAQKFVEDWPSQVGIIALQELTDEGPHTDVKCLTSPQSNAKHGACFRALLRERYIFNDTLDLREGGQFAVISGAPWHIVDRRFLYDTWNGFLETTMRHSTRGWVFRFYSIHLKSGEEDEAYRNFQISHSEDIGPNVDQGGIVQQVLARVQPGELPPILAGDFNFNIARDPTNYALMSKHFYLANDLAVNCIKQPSGTDPGHPKTGDYRFMHVWIGRRTSFPVDSFQVLRFHTDLPRGHGIGLRRGDPATVLPDDPNTWEYTVNDASGNPQKVYILSDHDSPGFSLRVVEPTYHILVGTGDYDGAGTNAKVHITLLGSTSASSEIMLDQPGDFARGGYDRFRVYGATPAVGDIGQIRIRHDNTNEHASWFLHSVRIQDTKAGKVYRFVCDFWLADNLGDKKIERTCNVTETLTNYAVMVHTEGDDHAGTDADVHITLHSPDGTSQGSYLNTPNVDPFEAGSRDFFRLALSDLGEVTALSLQHDNSGDGPGWKLADIRLRNEATGKTWVFPCHNWLATNVGLKKTTATLDAAGCY